MSGPDLWAVVGFTAVSRHCFNLTQLFIFFVQEAEREEAEAALGGDSLRRQKSSVSLAAAASAWKQIQDRMKPPKCKGHNEDCVIRQVKKKGPNFGEESRPL